MYSVYPQQPNASLGAESGSQGEPQAPAPPPNTSDTKEFPALPGSVIVTPQTKRQQSKQQQQAQAQAQQAQMAAAAAQANGDALAQQKMRAAPATSPAVVEGKKPQVEYMQGDQSVPPEVVIQQQQQQQQQQQEQYALSMQQEQQIQKQMKEFGLLGYLMTAKQKIPDEVPAESIFSIQEIHEQPITPKPCYSIDLKKPRSEYINSLSLNTLFYAFFAMPGDKMQYLAAQRLCSLGWLYHMGFNTWVHPTKTINREAQTIGTWEVFNCENWNVVTADMVVFHKDLAPPLLEDKSD